MYPNNFVLYTSLGFTILSLIGVLYSRHWVQFLNVGILIIFMFSTHSIYQQMNTPDYLFGKAARIEDKQAFIQELYRLKTKIPHKEFIERLALWREYGEQIPDELFE